MSLLTLLIVLLVVAVLFGGYGSYRGGWGPYGWSPFGILLLILLVLLFTGGVHAQTESPAFQTCTANGPLPDATCTPGAFNPDVAQATIGETICVRGWTATIRPPIDYTNRLKRQQMAEYGLSGPSFLWEEDHLAALEIGGHPTDPHNLWPESWNRPEDGLGAHAKDAVENAARRAACRGTVPLVDLQQAMTTNWVALGLQLGVPGLGVVVPTPGTE